MSLLCQTFFHEITETLSSGFSSVGHRTEFISPPQAVSLDNSLVCALNVYSYTAVPVFKCFGGLKRTSVCFYFFRRYILVAERHASYFVRSYLARHCLLQLPTKSLCRVSVRQAVVVI